MLDRFLELVDHAMRVNPAPERRHSLWERAFAMARLASQEITDQRDVANLVLRAIEAGSPLLNTPLREEVEDDFRDLIGYSAGFAWSRTHTV